MQEQLKKIVDGDGILKDALEEMKAKKLSIPEILKSEKIKLIIHRLAAFVIAFRDSYIAKPDDAIQTVDDLIDDLAKRLDEMFALPFFLEAFDGAFFHYALTTAMKYIDGAGDKGTDQVAAYAAILQGEGAVG